MLNVNILNSGNVNSGGGAGTMASQNANDVAITGGSITGINTFGLVTVSGTSSISETGNTGTRNPTFARLYAQTLTTSASAQLLANFTCAVGKSLYLKITIHGLRTGGSAGSAGDCYSGEFLALFKNPTATASQVGSFEQVGGNTTTSNIAVTFAGTAVIITIAGFADTNITWNSKVEYSIV